MIGNIVAFTDSPLGVLGQRSGALEILSPSLSSSEVVQPFATFAPEVLDGHSSFPFRTPSESESGD